MVLTGRLDLSALAPVRGFPGAYLLAPVEASWQALCDEVERVHGWRPTLTSAGDAYRSYDRQRSVFLQRYRRTYAVAPGGRVDRRVWDGVPYWRWRDAAAAVPGTSNHGRGDTVDVRDPRADRSLAYGTKTFNDFAPIAARHGWSNVEGRSVGEAWHWRKTGPGIAPRPPDPLEDDMPTAQEIAEAVWSWPVSRVEGKPTTILQDTVDGTGAALGLVDAVKALPGRTAAAVAAVPVSRVAGKPSTWLQDTVDGTSAAMSTAAQVAALTAAVQALATGHGVDPATITAAAQAGARAALADLRITVTTD